MKRLSPAALLALKDALAVIYWYVRDFRGFITPLIDPALSAQLNWEQNKRTTSVTLIDHLAKNQDKHLDTLLGLMTAVTQMTDFSHLERLDGGAEKAKNARRAVEALRTYIKPYEEQIQEQRNQEKAREHSDTRVKQIHSDQEALAKLKHEFMETISPTDPQKRGFLLEKFLMKLFGHFDLDPKASFRVTGEQIDGAFTFDNNDYLLEAKWQNSLVAIDALDAFAGKVSRKLDNTLGLFISINGFSPDAISAHSRSRPAFILMDGTDLMGVLEARIGLDEILKRKRRHASQTGNTFLPLAAILQGN